GMIGGYVTVTLINSFGWPFLATLPVAFLVAAAFSIVCERTMFRYLYRSTDLDQCLLTIGLVFVSVAVAAYLYGTIQQPVQLPDYLRGSVHIGGLTLGVYRIFLIAFALVVTVALVAMLEYTRFGAQVRAAVDNQRMARGLGINVDSAFAITFALGSGLAGLGGALAIDIVGLDPSFALAYLVYVLIVVAVGGLGSIVPDLPGDDQSLDVAPRRAVREADVMATPSPALASPHDQLALQIRWRTIEVVFWLSTLLPFVLTPDYLVLASQIAVTALFALSLDLILGYAGIISLGHAAFFGFGAYTAGLIAKWGWGEPITGLAIAGAAAGLLGYLMSFIIARFRHLALIMITLGFGL
ncbi:MAG: hypothetical protein J0H89_15870, partial [Rhizobiales bacterium]|nr:hypothetical protein [Hyphomicrobiales bacterium]